MKRIIFSVAMIIMGSMLCYSQHYYTDLSASLSDAQKENKDVLMIFSGSDWCKPCIQLRSNVIESEEFQKYSSENLILLELDFPYSKKNKLSKEQTKHNEALADKYNSKGAFPKMILLDKEETVKGEVTYKKAYLPNDIVAQIKNLK